MVRQTAYNSVLLVPALTHMVLIMFEKVWDRWKFEESTKAINECLCYDSDVPQNKLVSGDAGDVIICDLIAYVMTMMYLEIIGLMMMTMLVMCLGAREGPCVSNTPAVVPADISTTCLPV